ncbi:hypothetical protein K474DRAFT_1708345, partial [Panus rudis PR-1116 ss-1]
MPRPKLPSLNVTGLYLTPAGSGNEGNSADLSSELSSPPDTPTRSLQLGYLPLDTTGLYTLPSEPDSGDHLDFQRESLHPSTPTNRRCSQVRDLQVGHASPSQLRAPQARPYYRSTEASGQDILSHNDHDSEPLDENGLAPYSSPHRGRTKAEKAAFKKEKRERKKQKRLEAKAADEEAKCQAREALAQQKAAEQEAAIHEAEAQKRADIREALSDLKERNISVGDLLLYISDPSNYAGRERHEGLFKSSDRLQRILNLWVGSSSSDTAREAVHAWALQYMAGVLSEEGGRTTDKGTLRTRVSLIEKPTSESLSLESTYNVLIDDCPNTTHLLRSFCTTPRQERTMSDLTKKKNKILGSTLSILLSARSQQNSYIRQVVGLYLYASGTQRQVFSVLSHFGISCSYPTLVGRPDHADYIGDNSSTMQTPDRPAESLLIRPEVESADADYMRPAISSHSTFEHSVGTRKTQDVNVVEEDEEGVRERTEESKEVCGTTSVDSGAKDVQGDKDSTESESAPDPAPAASKEKQPE